MWEHFCLVGPHHVLEVHRPGGGWVQRWESKQLVPARGLQGGYMRSIGMEMQSSPNSTAELFRCPTGVWAL